MLVALFVSKIASAASDIEFNVEKKCESTLKAIEKEICQLEQEIVKYKEVKKNEMDYYELSQTKEADTECISDLTNEKLKKQYNIWMKMAEIDKRIDEEKKLEIEAKDEEGITEQLVQLKGEMTKIREEFTKEVRHDSE